MTDQEFTFWRQVLSNFYAFIGRQDPIFPKYYLYLFALSHHNYTGTDLVKLFPKVTSLRSIYGELQRMRNRDYISSTTISRTPLMNPGSKIRVYQITEVGKLLWMAEFQKILAYIRIQTKDWQLGLCLPPNALERILAL